LDVDGLVALSSLMGNQCSEEVPCLDARRQPVLPQADASAPSKEASRCEAPLVSRSLAVESVGSRQDRAATEAVWSPAKPDETADVVGPRGASLAAPPSLGLDVDMTRLPDTYFDSDVGESPVLEDESVTQRFRYEFQSGAVYDGDWLHGSRHGLGKQMWPDGTEYVGQWLNGLASGVGYIKHSDGDCYAGQWVSGRAHGLGVYRFQDGAASYEGQFRCDHRDGLGVERWVDGSCYAGGFLQGRKSGFGSNTWPDGTVYHGSWRENSPFGPGEYALCGGTSFRGQWENSAPHGVGVYRWPDGKTYAGRYHFDKKEGFGILTEADGTVRQGYWVNGELEVEH